MKKFCWENIHFGRVMVRCGVNRMIIQFLNASIPPISRYSYHPFLQIILVQNSYCSAVPQAAVTTFAFSSVFIFVL